MEDEADDENKRCGKKTEDMMKKKKSSSEVKGQLSMSCEGR